jgi:hypothetical protein
MSTRPYYPVSRYTRRQFRAQAAMLRLLAGAVFAALLAMALLASDLAQAAQSNDPIARFDGGIGVQLALVGGLPNDVNGTQPPGRPWVISDLKGQVSGDGSFDIQGKGLLLAGGGNVGRTGGLHVRMRLYCGGTPFTSTEEVALEPNGDFRLRGQLAFVNPLADCPNSVLLILNAGPTGALLNGPWFAAGIPKD